MSTYDLACAVDRYLMANFGNALNHDEREEVRQEAFLGLADAKRRIVVVNAEAFLIRCARNAALSLLRSADRWRRYSFDPLDSPEANLPDHPASVEEIVISREGERSTWGRLGGLDPRGRRVIASFLAGWSMRDIAGSEGISISYAYKVLKRSGRAVVSHR